MSKKKRKTSHPTVSPKISVSDKLAAKKAAVLGAEKQKAPVVPIAIVLCAALIAVGVVGYALKNHEPSTPAVKPESVATHPLEASSSAPQAVSTENIQEVVSYPETMFMDGVAKFFKHTHGDITIKYFILRSIDGVIRAAFDACDVCWPAGKGYVQDGGDMICRNCGRRFASTSINEVKGGCNPAPLEREMKDGAVFIKLEKIIEGQGYFDFSQHT